MSFNCVLRPASEREPPYSTSMKEQEMNLKNSFLLTLLRNGAKLSDIVEAILLDGDEFNSKVLEIFKKLKHDIRNDT